LNSRFASAGFLPLSREDRIYALDHLGLPESFQPSRATALRLAQTLDANYILIGSFRVDGNLLTLRSRIIDVDKLRISEEVTEKGPLAELIPLLNSLAWQLTRKLDPSFRVAEETFRAAGGKVRLDAFEQYIRGITENDPNNLTPNNLAERRRHLLKATELNPNFTEAWLAIGKLEFAAQNYEQAAVAFSKVTRGDPDELEAAFYRGLSLMFTGNYPRAEEAFAAIARVLPLPEVVNNEGVAISRRGHDAIALFKEAVAADPTDADYHFNLAVSLHTHGDKAESLKELAASLKLHPEDSEAKAAKAAWTSSLTESVPANTDYVAPLERIKRTYNGAAFREAGLMLEQVEEARLAALPSAQRAALLSKAAHEKLDRGLLLEAERGYTAALAADDRNSDAYAGLAEVRERAGDPDAARKEAIASNQRKPNLEAYMVLARVDLATNNLTQARDEANEAVKLDASSRAAKDLRKSIENRIENRTSGTNSSSNKSATSPATE
jgi:tetratricopeptide (TPR) repeat protein